MNNQDIEISKALSILSKINSEARWEKICEISSIQLNNYNLKLKEFKRLNSLNKKIDIVPQNINKLKGDALEDLVYYLLEISGDLFEVERNLRTTTNEIDQVIVLKPKGKVLLNSGLLNRKLERILGECKNYNKIVDVTYVGKFCSLLLTTGITLGLLFSYHGISGSGWNYGSGLIKKFYLHKEDLEKRYCIIDFSLKEFDMISQGHNLLEIIEDKLLALQLDTDYIKLLSKHPAES